MSVVYSAKDSLHWNIPIYPKLSSSSFYSSFTWNEVNISSFKPSKGSDGDVLLTVNQILSGTFELLLLRCALKAVKNLCTIFHCLFLFWKSCIIWGIFRYFHRLCSYLSFCELTTIKYGLKPKSSIKHFTFRISTIIFLPLVCREFI